MFTLNLSVAKCPPAWLLSLLCAILVLPLFEAPKTIFLILFFILCGFSLWRNKANLHFDGDDVLLLCWMLSGYVVALFAGIHHKEWSGANGVLVLALLLGFLKLSNLGDQYRYRLAFAILLSTFIANVEGLWQLAVTGQNQALELNSVGHVNHSAIYLGLNFALALSMTLTLKKSDTFVSKSFVVAALLLTAASIIISDSRATVMTMAVIAISLGLVWLKRSKLPLLLLVVSLFITAGTLVSDNASVVQKHVKQTSRGPILGERAAIWNSALLAWRHSPVFGLGIRNYGQATAELQEQWLAAEGKQYVAGQYLAYAHAHNLYLSTLAEQGVFGFSITMLVLLRICFLLFRHRPQVFDSDVYWLSWCAAFGALQIVMINGLFNTTLHHEHGLLAVLLIGIWWSSLKQRTQA